MGPKEIINDIYLVGDSDLTDSRDCSIYLLNLGEMVLIDTGAGSSVDMIIRNIEELGFDPTRLSTIILTHCHIDHVGGAYELRKRLGSRIIMHALDADVVERGDDTMTAAYWYGVRFEPLPVDVKFDTKEERFNFGGQEIVCLHTPGHSPGSISVYLDRGEKRVLFGQDIHGPFLTEFGANMSHWQKSMEKLLALKVDVLCEGHFGIYQPNEKVTEYIERYLDEYGE
ncbi:MAG: MBL fold metallo-hydrolase [Proteobacteria bacterium]|nr:MBL fold metallo-hydrolase [Pseudomonadota bacterium]